MALRRHALGDGMLDTHADVARRAAAPGRQPVDQAHAGLEAEDQCLGRHAGDRRPRRSQPRASRSAISRIGVALGYIDFRFPELALAQRASAPRRLVRDFRGAAVRQGQPSRWTSHDPSPQHRRRAHHRRDRVFRTDARPGFSLSGDRQGRARRGAEGECQLARAEPLRAAHGPADRHDPALGAARRRQRDRDRHRRRQPQAAPGRAHGPAQHAGHAVARGDRRRAGHRSRMW